VDKTISYLELVAVSSLLEAIQYVRRIPTAVRLDSRRELERLTSDHTLFRPVGADSDRPIAQRMTLGSAPPHTIDSFLRLAHFLRGKGAVETVRAVKSIGREDTIPAHQPTPVDDTGGIVRWLPIQLPLMALTQDVALLLAKSDSRGQPHVLVVSDQVATSLLKAGHDFLWSATEVHPDTQSLDPIPPHLKELVIELAAGSTSAGAARKLHISDRTISRRMGEILDHLGAKSPFQAGFIAARLWPVHDLKCGLER
jgi:hypothetical protein